MVTNERGDDEPIINLLGEKIALGPMRREQLPQALRWQNDFDVLRTTSVVRPVTREALELAYEQGTAARDQVHFTIYERAGLRPIGGVNLHDITQRTATFAISIGAKDCWGKGYGTEAARLVLDYGFNALGLHNIMLTVFGFNERGIRAYRRAGFREIGRRRQVIARGGQLDDLVYMDCVAGEFQGLGVHQLMLTGARSGPQDNSL